MNSIDVTRKVAYKVRVLLKSAFLFDIEFKTILFKLFFLSTFDYCSSLFVNFSSHNYNYKNPASSLVKSLMSFKKTYGSLRRDPFKTPLFKTNLGSFSFLNILPLKF